jgi:hypothetical protein
MIMVVPFLPGHGAVHEKTAPQLRDGLLFALERVNP